MLFEKNKEYLDNIEDQEESNFERLLDKQMET